MYPRFPSRNRATSLALVLACFFSTARATIILIEENFGGSGVNLNGSPADTFAAALSSAGGSATWSAPSKFKDNGSLVSTGGGSGSASLALGSYINGAKGTPAGLFTITATMTQPVAGSWVTVGFLTGNDINLNFVNNNGLATALHRASDAGSNYYLGPATGGAHDPGILSGTVTFTTVLDLTPEGGYNGTTHFGTVRFSNSLGVGGTHAATFTTERNFGRIGFTYSGDGLTATLSDFRFTQIPEPSSLALLGFALLALGFGVRRWP